MSNCEKCGAKNNINAKFCSNCGAKQALPTPPPPPVTIQQTTMSPPPPPPPPPPQASSTQMPATMPTPTQNMQDGTENTVGVILLRQQKSFGRYDTYTGVITNQRFIFAQMTNDMLKDAAMQAKEQAKAEGKGFWSQWSEQFKASMGYSKRYLTMSSQAILSETPGNFALNNYSIQEIVVHLKGTHQDNQRREFEIEIKSTGGKYRYRMDENSSLVDVLKKVYLVRMPLGYFSKTINIGKF
jgi:hypothetical protein